MHIYHHEYGTNSKVKGHSSFRNGNLTCCYVHTIRNDDPLSLHCIVFSGHMHQPENILTQVTVPAF